MKRWIAMGTWILIFLSSPSFAGSGPWCGDYPDDACDQPLPSWEVIDENQCWSSEDNVKQTAENLERLFDQHYTYPSSDVEVGIEAPKVLASSLDPRIDTAYMVLNVTEAHSTTVQFYAYAKFNADCEIDAYRYSLQIWGTGRLFHRLTPLTWDELPLD